MIEILISDWLTSLGREEWIWICKLAELDSCRGCVLSVLGRASALMTAWQGT